MKVKFSSHSERGQPCPRVSEFHLRSGRRQEARTFRVHSEPPRVGCYDAKRQSRGHGCPRSVLVVAIFLLLSAGLASAETYNWKSVTIHGGGFVSGIITHPNAPGVVYCRTDIGAAYRWNSASNSWIPLLDFAANNSL